MVVGPGPFGVGIAIPFGGHHMAMPHPIHQRHPVAFGGPVPAHGLGMGYSGPFARLAPPVRDLLNE
jgi:hypothetical protein